METGTGGEGKWVHCDDSHDSWQRRPAEWNQSLHAVPAPENDSAWDCWGDVAAEGKSDWADVVVVVAADAVDWFGGLDSDFVLGDWDWKSQRQSKFQSIGLELLPTPPLLPWSSSPWNQKPNSTLHSTPLPSGLSLDIYSYSEESYRIESWRRASPRAENKSNFKRVSALRLDSRCAFWSWRAVKRDMTRVDSALGCYTNQKQFKSKLSIMNKLLLNY